MLVSFLLLLAPLVFAISILHVSATSKERINSSIEEYKFLRSECIAGNFLSSPVIESSLLGSLAASSLTNENECLLSNGLRSSASQPHMWQSLNNISNFRQILGTNDFTIELWFQPSVNNPQDTTILSVEREIPNPSFSNLKVSCMMLRYFACLPSHPSSESKSL